MDVKKVDMTVMHADKQVPVFISIFKPDEHTRYRCVLGDINRDDIIMLYRQDDGKFFTYEDFDRKELAKVIAGKIRKLEKQHGAYLHEKA